MERELYQKLKLLATRVNRLFKFYKIIAPNLVIERERLLVLRTLELLAPADPAITALAKEGMSKTCPVCNGDDGPAPCAFPGKGQPGCLRDRRLALEEDRQTGQDLDHAAAILDGVGATRAAAIIREAMRRGE